MLKWRTKEAHFPANEEKLFWQKGEKGSFSMHCHNKLMLKMTQKTLCCIICILNIQRVNISFLI